MASRREAAPRTVTVTSLVAPSPSATSMRASRSRSASRARANWRSPRLPRSRATFSARPLARTATVSLVDWSPSTVIRLNERSTPRRVTPARASRAMTASVVTKQNIVARCGSSIPTPLAMPPSVTGRPPTSTRSAASLGRVSVVMMASAAARPPWGERALTSFGKRRPDALHGQGDADDPGGGDEHVLGGDAQEIAHHRRHLARVAKPLVARAHVGTAAGGQDGLGDAARGRAPRRR